jgi:hypothetical protein
MPAPKNNSAKRKSKRTCFSVKPILLASQAETPKIIAICLKCIDKVTKLTRFKKEIQRLLVVVRFVFKDAKTSVQLFDHKQANHLVGKCHF